STRDFYNKMMLKLLKKAPADCIRSIEQYLEGDATAKEAWFASSPTIGDDDVDVKIGKVGGGRTPITTTPTSPRRSLRRRPTASTTSAQVEASGNQAPATPSAAKKKSKPVKMEVGTRTGLRSARAEDFQMVSQTAVGTGFERAICHSKHEKRWSKIGASLHHPRKPQLIVRQERKRWTRFKSHGSDRVLAGDGLFVNIFRTLFILGLISIITLLGVGLYYMVVTWEMLEELEERVSGLDLD
ncbi:Thrombospondin type-1 domain-containing protein 4, partial [Orchesella cincta]